MAAPPADLAYRDALTGLANRAAFDAALEAMVADGRPAALAYADLDEFKRVNDTLGHETGDQLLREVAERLSATAGPGDLVARLGGDEFVLLAAGEARADRADAESVGQRIADALAAPFALGAAELLVEASVGVSRFPEDARCGADLRKRADAAMYEAKRAGSGVAVYTERTADPLERLELAARLRRGIDAGELELHFQPVHRLPETRVMGVEALVRWRRDGRLVPPLDFVGVAERTGVIDRLGDWVLDAALAQLAEWDRAGLSPNLGVNVSPRQLRRAGAAARMAQLAALHGVDPSRVVLEITETAWSLEVARLLPVLRDLRAAGFALAIDDFGAGYSSLWRLRELPVQVIKVDRAFLRGVPDDPQAAAVFTAILRLADACGQDVVAEGVEDPAQLAFLIEGGCRLAQGFHLGRPEPAERLAAALMSGVVDERRRAAS